MTGIDAKEKDRDGASTKKWGTNDAIDGRRGNLKERRVEEIDSQDLRLRRQRGGGGSSRLLSSMR